MRLVDTIDIAAPAERVWPLTENVEAWPSFSPTMTRIERLDDAPIALGSRARVEQPAQRPAVWTVTRFEAGGEHAHPRAVGRHSEGVGHARRPGAAHLAPARERDVQVRSRMRN